MYAVILNTYGDENNLQYVKDLPKPSPKPNQVLVKVHASSVNPIDLMKREGYGKAVFEKQRRTLFPWILGSDFSGTIVEVGSKISNFQIGNEVWGCTSNSNCGTHAEYVCIDANEITYKPINIDHLSAASLPYVALTTWSAIVRWAGLRPTDLEGKKIFIQGGAGGVGCFSIQLFKNLGCEVATTCSQNNIDLMYSLGADKVIDYNKENFENVLSNFDIAYDLHGESVLSNAADKFCGILKQNKNSHYITLTHPFVTTLDEKGLLLGVPHALYLRHKLKKRHSPINIHWSIYRPSISGLEQLTDLVQEHKIKPIIDSVFSIDKLGDAHKKLAVGHVSGKVVVDHKND